LLSGPITDKESGDGRSQELGLIWGYSGMQGWRDRMEDAHLAVPSLAALVGPQQSGWGGPGWRGTAVFGVMDGHGGEHVAHFCERYMPAEIARGPSEDVGRALREAFFRMDELLADPANLDELQSLSNDLSPPAFKSWRASPECIGCTAVICCIRRDSVVVANAGDSRAVLCRRGMAVELSEDHKPNLPSERARIKRAGGCVVEQHVAGHTHYRVNGNLNLSRSIGDLAYKQNMNLGPQDQMICCAPDIRQFKRQAGDEFLVIACDGVWDVLSSQEVIDFVRPRLGNLDDLDERYVDRSQRLSAIVEDLLDHCLSPDLAQTSGLGGDNMTMVLVAFAGCPPETQENWFDAAGQAIGATSWLCPYK